MAQVKIYGLREQMKPKQLLVSQVIHSCLMDAFQYPAEKKFHRFIHLDQEDFIYPQDRSESYTIIEISIFEGRSVKAKKELVQLLFERLRDEASIAVNDVEITIIETPRHAWGIRGVSGDDL